MESWQFPRITRVRGRVTSLVPDQKARLHAGLNLDLTPFHAPKVEFDELEVAGRFLPLHSEGAVTGTPLLTLVAPGASRHKPLIARQWAKARGRRTRPHRVFHGAWLERSGPADAVQPASLPSGTNRSTYGMDV